MKKKLTIAVAILMASLTLTSCDKMLSMFEPFDDKPLIEELPLSFRVMRTYVGKYETDLDALLVRLGCTKLDSPVYFNNGWNIMYIANQDMAHLTYYSYVNGDDQYLFVLNSTNKSGKTFQVFWEKDYDSQVQRGLELFDEEENYVEGKEPVLFDAKFVTVGGETYSSFDSKDDFVSQVTENAASSSLWGISCNYSMNEGTMLTYSPVNYGESYMNTRCITNKDADIDFSDITNNLFDMATVSSGAKGSAQEIVLEGNAEYQQQ